MDLLLTKQQLFSIHQQTAYGMHVQIISNTNYTENIMRTEKLGLKCGEKCCGRYIYKK